jgi:hypothetical protein
VGEGAPGTSTPLYHNGLLQGMGNRAYAHPRDAPYYSWRGLVHTEHTRPTGSRNGSIQWIYSPPSDAEIHHPAPTAVPAANLGPGTRPEPAPTTTHGGYGRNSTGGWLTDDPGGAAATTHVWGGCGATRVAGKRGKGGAACRVSPSANPRACILPRTDAAIGGGRKNNILDPSKFRFQIHGLYELQVYIASMAFSLVAWCTTPGLE